MKQKKSSLKDSVIQSLSVVDLILIDHRFLKECIEHLCDENFDKRRKLSLGRAFLEALEQHSQCEKKAIYAPLLDHEDLHFNILEAEIEHGLIDQKVKTLKPRLKRAKLMRDELEAELKVLSELVKHHLMEEESATLNHIQEFVDDETLREMGIHFMKLRQFTTKELQDYPQLQDELIQWKDSIQKVSSEFLIKMDRFMENIQH